MGKFEVVSERAIRVALDATAIGRGKTGNETYLTGLLEGWKAAKPEGVEILPIFSAPSFAPNPDKVGGGASEGWKSAALQNRRARFFRRHLVELPAARRELKADLYHGVYWVRPWEKEPFVLTVHDISFAVHSEWFRPGEALFYSTLVKAAARKARKVIAVSEFCPNPTIPQFPNLLNLNLHLHLKSSILALWPSILALSPSSPPASAPISSPACSNPCIAKPSAQSPL